MKTYHVKTLVKSIEIYAVDAESAEEALKSWEEQGILIDTDETVLECEPLSAEEA